MLTFLDEQAKYSSRDIPNASQLTFDDGLSAHSDLEGLIQQLDNELDLSVNDESASLSLNQSDLLLDTGNEDENVHLDMEDLDGLDDEESRLLPSSTPSTCTPSAFVNNGISNDGQEGPSTVNMGMALDAEALAELDELSLDDGLSNVGDTAPISSFAPSPSLDSPIENGPSVAVSVTQLKDDRSTPTKAEVQEQTLESPPSTLRPQFLTYPSTPAIPPDLDSPQAFPSIENQSRYPMQDSSSNLMEETRREMQALRELNERLVRVNEEYKDALGMRLIQMQIFLRKCSYK